MTAIIIDMNKRDPLTSLERVSLALQYKQPDRVPVAPLVCGASHRVLGITYDRWSQDADLAVQSLLDAQELIGFDAWLTLVDLSVEAYDFGQEVIFPRASTAYPNTDNPRIKTVEDYYRLEKVDPLKTKRMRHVIDIVAGLSRAKGQEIAINGFVYGPLGVLSQIRGHERLFKDLIRQPDAVLHAVELITGVLEIYAREQVRAGARRGAGSALLIAQRPQQGDMGEVRGPVLEADRGRRARRGRTCGGPQLRRRGLLRCRDQVDQSDRDLARLSGV